MRRMEKGVAFQLSSSIPSVKYGYLNLASEQKLEQQVVVARHMSKRDVYSYTVDPLEFMEFES